MKQVEIVVCIIYIYFVTKVEKSEITQTIRARMLGIGMQMPSLQRSARLFRQGATRTLTPHPTITLKPVQCPYFVIFCKNTLSKHDGIAKK